MSASDFDPDLAERLRALDLAQVAISAAIDAEGRLGPVGGLWPKLQAAAEGQARLGLLHTIVVAKEQKGVPESLTAPDAWPLRIRLAATLKEAVDLLSREALPRQTIARRVPNTFFLLHTEVPLKTCYRDLPLLRPVKRERLPRAEGELAGEEAEVGWRSLRTVEIRQWEEVLRREPTTYDPVPLNVNQVLQDFKTVVQRANDNVPRFIVLGPPGGGKTTLLRYLAWWCVRKDAPLQIGGQSLAPAYVRLREWEAWAEQNLNYHLHDFLAEQHRGPNAPDADLWRRWLRLGMVFLLLDGLDEIEGTPDFIARGLKELLRDRNRGRCPLILTCRTVSFEQHQVLEEALPVFALAGLTPEQQAAFIRNYPALHPNFNPEGLIAQLRGTPGMEALATNPQLLSILCFVADNSAGVPLLATQGELYHQAIDKLLEHVRVMVRYPTSSRSLSLAHRRALVEEATLRLWLGVGGCRQLTFDERTILKALTEAAQAKGYNAPVEVAEALLVNLRDNSGLLRGKPGDDHFFLHLTLQEFLVACTLARQVNRQGWEKASATLADGQTISVAELLDHKAWDPAWQEVIVLLAGRLQKPDPLLVLLTDASRDDLFRHRLALAAHALEEVGREKAGRWTDEITTTLFNLWWHEDERGVEFTHWFRALPALVRVNGRVDGLPLLDLLVQRLHNPDRSVRQRVNKVLKAVGTAAARPDVLAAQIQSALRDLRAPEWWVRDDGAEALGKVGAAAATTEVLATLIQSVLRDPDERVRRYSAEALKALEAADKPDVLAVLIEALNDPDIREYAVQALGTIGSTTTTAGILAALIQGALNDLRDSYDAFVEEEVRSLLRPRKMQIEEEATDDFARSKARAIQLDLQLALRSLRYLGAAAATPEVLAALLEVLHDPEMSIRDEAVQALGAMGEAAATAEVLTALIEALHDPDPPVRHHAAQALLAMMGNRGKAVPEVLATLPKVLVALIEALNDPNEDVRAEAVLALWGAGGRGAEAATPEILAVLPGVLAALVKALEDLHEDVRESVPWALRKIVSRRVSWAIMEVVSERRIAAAPEVLAVLPGVLAALVKALNDPHKDVRESVATALGKMGEVAATANVLDALLDALTRSALHDPSGEVRGTAAEALMALGAAAIPPATQTALVQSALRDFHDPNWGVRHDAAKALDAMFARGVRLVTYQVEKLAVL